MCTENGVHASGSIVSDVVDYSYYFFYCLFVVISQL